MRFIPSPIRGKRLPKIRPAPGSARAPPPGRQRPPQRVNRLLDEVADGQFGVKVDTGIDPEHIMLGLQ